MNVLTCDDNQQLSVYRISSMAHDAYVRLRQEKGLKTQVGCYLATFSLTAAYGIIRQLLHHHRARPQIPSTIIQASMRIQFYIMPRTLSDNSHSTIRSQKAYSKMCAINGYSLTRAIVLDNRY
jgi:hypothetical protein